MHSHSSRVSALPAFSRGAFTSILKPFNVVRYYLMLETHTPSHTTPPFATNAMGFPNLLTKCTFGEEPKPLQNAANPFAAVEISYKSNHEGAQPHDRKTLNRPDNKLSMEHEFHLKIIAAHI